MHIPTHQSRVSRLGRFIPGIAKGPVNGWWRIDAITVEYFPRLDQGCGIGHGRAGCYDARLISRYIRDKQTRDPRRGRGSGQTTALDARKMLAHAVHFGDRGTAGQ